MFISNPSTAAIVECIRDNPPAAGESLAIFLAEDGAPDLAELQAALCEQPVPFFGAIFPGVIHGRRSYSQGAVIKSLPTLGGPVRVSGLSAGSIAIPPAPEGAETALVMVDGLTSRVALFLSELYKASGSGLHYFGGGAGSLSLQQAPCIIDRDGVHQDAAVMLYMPLRSRLGVRHGWEELYGPMLATRTDRNVIHELNWRPALQVYREVVEGDSGATLTREGFFDVSKGYPFGLVKTGNEPVIRDPISVTETGGLVCVGEVPEHTAVSIFRGRSDALIAAAGDAIGDCLASGRGRIREALIADCISRSIFLEARFGEELDVIANRLDEVATDVVLAGALTLGEISSVGDSYLEFFNKTCVIATLAESH